MKSLSTLSKPISSPGRADKFPPPLMRFLRTNAASRSRKASRASPIFYLRSRKNAGGKIIEATQEPSSPKVTCIGQVRVRRSKKKKSKKTAAKNKNWWCFKKPLFLEKKLKIFSPPKTTAFRGVLRKWGLCFRCKKVDTLEDSFRVCCDEKGVKNGVLDCGVVSVIDENLGAKVQEKKRDFSSVDGSSSSPPKNALLLTRCRSAPYRSSSLGGIFWGSPLKTGENGAENEVKLEELQRTSCENVEESRISEESSIELLEDSVKNDEELKGIAGGSLHPLLLTRCKSEPARTGERLVVSEEASFWKQRRFGKVVESFSDDNS